MKGGKANSYQPQTKVVEEEVFEQGASFTCSYRKNCCISISFVNVIFYIKPTLKASLLPQKAAKANTIKRRDCTNSQLSL